MNVLTNLLKISCHSKKSSINKNATSTTHYCGDETQRDKRIEPKRTKITNSVNNLRTAILEDSGSWVRPEFQTLRNFVDATLRNPAKFPKTREHHPLHMIMKKMCHF